MTKGGKAASSSGWLMGETAVRLSPVEDVMAEEALVEVVTADERVFVECGVSLEDEVLPPEELVLSSTCKPALGGASSAAGRGGSGK